MRALVRKEQNSRDHDYCHNNSRPKQISASAFCCLRYRFRFSISRLFSRHFVFSSLRESYRTKTPSTLRDTRSGMRDILASHPQSRIPNKPRNLTPESQS